MSSLRAHSGASDRRETSETLAWRRSFNVAPKRFRFTRGGSGSQLSKRQTGGCSQAHGPKNPWAMMDIVGSTILTCPFASTRAQPMALHASSPASHVPSGVVLFRAATQRVPLKLGQGYNVRKDTAIDFNIFNHELTESVVSRSDSHKSTVRLIDDACTKDKFEALNIDGDLKLSVMMNMVEVDGCGQFIFENRQDSNVAAIHLTSVLQTEIEQVDIFKSSVRELMDGSRLTSAMDTTHVVTGVIYGGRAVCSFVLAEANATKRKEVMVRLKSMLTDLQVSISGGGYAKPSDAETSIHKNVELRIDGDFLVDSALPVTVDGVLDFFKSLPMKLNEGNNGRGVPIGYRLSPLIAFAAVCDSIKRVDTICGQIANDKLDDIEFTIETTKQGMMKLDAFHNWMRSKASHFTANEIERVSKRLRKVARTKSKFITAMRDLVQSFRSDPDESVYEEMDDAIETATKECSEAAIDAYISTTWKGRVDYVQFLDRETANEAVSMLPDNDALDTGRCIVLLLSFDLWHTWSSETKTALRLFHLLVSEQKYQNLPTRFFICDFREQQEALPRAQLRELRDGHSFNDDLERTMAGLLKSRVRMNPVGVQRGIAPKGDHSFSLVCPGRYLERSCSSQYQQWACVTCLEPLKYWYDGKVGCNNCGVCAVELCEFKCNDPNHGADFVQFDPSKQKLSFSQADDEINLLFIGETGVGKSTIICSMANFFTFETLDEAIENVHSLLVPLPVNFRVTGGGFQNGVAMEAGESVHVELGDNSDHNECHEDGESATQHCKSYVIYDQQSGKRIRLIDVPGIGDTRGLKQDKENVDEIISFIAKFDHISAICIVMKSNQTRLTDSFEYCLMEILTRVHESAVKNLTFLFTYARSSMYDIGDTYGPLKRLLDGLSKPSSSNTLHRPKRSVDVKLTRDRMYFFDNEGFKTACAFKKGITYDTNMVQNMAQSWTKSRESTMRLRHFVTMLEPHATEGTVLLNRVRNDVQQLQEPMRVLLENLQDNIKKAQVTEAQLQDIKSNREDLEANRFVESYKLVPFELKHPTTVCTNPHCVSVEQIDSNKPESQTVYKTKCHEGCRTRSVPTSKTTCKTLKYCRVMTYSGKLKALNNWTKLPADLIPINGTCQHCWAENGKICYWYHHMHVTMDYKRVLCRTELTSVKKKIESIQESEGAVDVALRNLRRLQQEQQEEHDMLTKACAQFAFFVVHNSVAPVNYYALEMIKLKIEHAKTNNGEYSYDVQFLTEAKHKMEQEIAVLENAYEMSLQTDTICNKLSPQAVQSTIAELCSLKHSGETLKAAFETTKIIEISSTRETIIAASPPAERTLYRRGKNMIGGVFRTGKNAFARLFERSESGSDAPREYEDR